MSDAADRIERLERLVRQLHDEVMSLRAEVRAGRAAPSPTTPAPREEPLALGPEAFAATGDEVRRPTAASTSGAWQPGASGTSGRGPGISRATLATTTPADVESLVGRYGTIALAALTIIMGVGAFLRWALEHVQIGAGARVALGALAAALLAALGWRLRARGARQYGDTLVGLALAVVHVVAWGAGPYLGIISDGAALAVAAVASVALAAIAWHEGEQALFTVGTFGALLAPFVTSSGMGRIELLLAYGLVVTITGTMALRGRDWRIARRVLASGVFAYVASALASTSDIHPWPLHVAPSAFALLCAAGAIVAGGEAHRRPLAYAHLASALLAMLALVRPAPPVAAAVVLGVVGAVLAMLASRGEEDHARAREEEAMGGTLAASPTGAWRVAPAEPAVPWIGGIGFPLAWMGATLVALPVAVGTTGAVVALVHAALAALAAAVAWRARAERRGAHVATMLLAAVAMLLLALSERPLPLVLSLAALAVAGAALARRTATPLALPPAIVAVITASVAAGLELAERPAWSYTPFLTAASLGAAAAVAAWVLVAREGAATRLGRRRWDRERQLETGHALRGTAAIAALLWGREELRHAFDPGLATFLLIGFYATAGVVAIAAGRHVASATARRAGLALAVLAALKALVQASSLGSVGLRVGSYLLVGGFLLGVAWWYRHAGSGGDAADGDPAAPVPGPAGAGVGAPGDGVRSADLTPFV